MREGIEARKSRYRASCPSVPREPTRHRRLYNLFPTIAIIRRRTLLLTTLLLAIQRRKGVRSGGKRKRRAFLGYRPSGLHRGERSISFGLLLGGSILLTEITIPAYHSGLLSLFGHASELRGLGQDLPVPLLHVVLVSLRLAYVPLTGMVCAGRHPSVSCGWEKPTA